MELEGPRGRGSGEKDAITARKASSCRGMAQDANRHDAAETAGFKNNKEGKHRIVWQSRNSHGAPGFGRRPARLSEEVSASRSREASGPGEERPGKL